MEDFSAYVADTTQSKPHAQPATEQSFLQELWQGVSTRVDKARSEPGTIALELGVSAAAGTALALFAKNPTALMGGAGSIARYAPAVLGIAAISDTTARLTGAYDGSPTSLGERVGKMAVDYSTMGLAGLAGSKIGGSIAHRALAERSWFHSPVVMEAEANTAAKVMADSVRAMSQRLPLQGQADAVMTLKGDLTGHITDAYAITRDRGASMASRWMAEQPLPTARATPETIARFQKELTTGITDWATALRNDHLAWHAAHPGNTLLGFNIAPGAGSRQFPSIQMGDAVTTQAAIKAGISEADFKALTYYRSAFGHVPVYELSPGSVTTGSKLFHDYQVLHPNRVNHWNNAALGGIPSVADMLRKK